MRVRDATRGALPGVHAVLACGVVLLAGLSWVSAQTAPHVRREARDGGVTVDLDASVPTAPPRGDGGAPDAVSSSPGPSDLDVRRAQAGAAFAEGMTAYRRGDFVVAAAHFETAYQTLPNAAPLFNLARSWEGANDIQRAIESYERYLRESPTAPDAEAVRERIETLRSRPTDVFVSSEPAGASVFVDEDREAQREVTPLVLRLPPGPHMIRVGRDGYREYVRRFESRPGVPETFSILLTPDASRASAGAVQGRVDARILNRRMNGLATRFGFTFGAARAWNNQPLALVLGGEATLFFNRYLAGRVRVERIEPDGVWTLASVDMGFVLPFEDLDIGLYATSGAAVGWIDYDAYLARAPVSVVPVLGAEARIDWVFHPHLSLGLFFRAAWRNFFVAPIEPLNSFGLSVSLSL